MPILRMRSRLTWSADIMRFPRGFPPDGLAWTIHESCSNWLVSYHKRAQCSGAAAKYGRAAPARRRYAAWSPRREKWRAGTARPTTQMMPSVRARGPRARPASPGGQATGLSKPTNGGVRRLQVEFLSGHKRPGGETVSRPPPGLSLSLRVTQPGCRCLPTRGSSTRGPGPACRPHAIRATEAGGRGQSGWH